MNETDAEGWAVCLADFFLEEEGSVAPRMNTCGISGQIMTVILMLSQGQSIYSVSDRRSRRPSSGKHFFLFLLKTHFYFPVVPKQGFYKTGDIATQAVCRIPLN